MNKSPLILFYIAVLLLASINARGDTIILKNGSMAKCNIIKETDASHRIGLLEGSRILRRGQKLQI